MSREASMQEKVNHYKMMEKVLKSFIFFFLLIVCFIVLYPLVYTVSAAFTPVNSISALSIIPFGNGITMEHFTYLFNETNYLLWIKNTVEIDVALAIINVFLNHNR